MKKIIIPIFVFVFIVSTASGQELCEEIDPITMTLSSMSQPVIDCMISQNMQISNEQFALASENMKEIYVLGEFVDFKDEKQRETFVKMALKNDFDFNSNIKSVAKYYVYLYDEEKEKSENLWKEDDYKIFEKMSAKNPELINLNVQSILGTSDGLKFIFIYYAEKKEEVKFTDIKGSFSNYKENEELFNTSGDRWTEFTLRELKLYEALGYSGFYIEENGKLSAEKFKDEKICEDCEVTVSMFGVHVQGKDVKLPNGAKMISGSATIYNNDYIRFFGQTTFTDKNSVRFETSGTTDYLFNKGCTSANVYSCIEYYESPSEKYYGFYTKSDLAVYDYEASIEYMNIGLIEGDATLRVFGPDNSAIFASKEKFRMRGEMNGMIRFEQNIRGQDCVGFYNSYSYKCGENVFLETNIGDDISNKANNMANVYDDFSEKYKVGEKYPEGIEPEHKMIAGVQVPGTFSCTDLITYAQKYLGTGYAQSGTQLNPCSAERAQKKLCKTQCGSFVTSVFFYGISPEVGYSLTSKYGKDKCNARGIGQKFTDSSNLRPGDIFTSSAPGNSAGHTGIFVGVGRVENLFTGKSSCYKNFIPDPTGEPVFIHSMGPVCYSTLNDLKVKQRRTIYTYCRVEGC